MLHMSVDAILLGMLAIGDLLLIGYLRYRRSEAVRDERLMRSLVFAVRVENGDISMPDAPRMLAEVVRPEAAICWQPQMHTDSRG